MVSSVRINSKPMQRSDASLLAEEMVYNGFFKLHRLKLQHKLFSGAMGEPLTRELLARGPATCLLPYDPVADAVVVCEQFRIGAFMHGQSPWLIELVAGINDSGEGPEQTARREAVEEAGLVVQEIVPICEYYPSPGGSDEWITLLCGRVNSAGSEGIYGMAEEGEDIRVQVLAREDAFAMIAKGQLINAASIIGMQWLQLNHSELKEKWGSR